MQFHGPNVLSCEIVSGIKRTPLAIVYLTLTTLYHLPDLEEALNRFPGIDPIVLEELKSDLVWMGNPKTNGLKTFWSLLVC